MLNFSHLCLSYVCQALEFCSLLDLQPILDSLTGVLNDMFSLCVDCGGIFVLRPECLLTNLDDLLSRQ